MLSGPIAAAAAWFGAKLTSDGDPAAVWVVPFVAVLGTSAVASTLVVMLGRSDHVSTDTAGIRVSALRTWPSTFPLLLWRVQGATPWTEVRSIKLFSGISAFLELTGKQGTKVRVCPGVLDCSPYVIATRLFDTAARRGRADLVPEGVPKVFGRRGRRHWLTLGVALFVGSALLLACLFAGACLVETTPAWLAGVMQMIAIPFTLAAAAIVLGARPQERLIVDGLGVTLDRGSSCDHVSWDDLQGAPVLQQNGGLKQLLVVGRNPLQRIEWTTLGPGAEEEVVLLAAAIQEKRP